MTMGGLISSPPPYCVGTNCYCSESDGKVDAALEMLKQEKNWANIPM